MIKVEQSASSTCHLTHHFNYQPDKDTHCEHIDSEFSAKIEVACAKPEHNQTRIAKYLKDF